MTTFVEDFSTWDAEALIRVPPESLEAADLMALVIELQNRLKVHYYDRVRSDYGGW